MKNLITSLILFASLSLSIASCDKSNDPTSIQENGNYNVTITNPTGSKMKITIGSAVFTATLYDNPSVTAFKTRLPLTINMEEGKYIGGRPDVVWKQLSGTFLQKMLVLSLHWVREMRL